MKKLLFILFAFITLSSYSQHYQDIILSTSAVMSADTSFAQYVPDNYTWSISANWSSVAGTKDGVLKVQISDDGINYINYADLDSATISTASGYITFEDVYFAHKFIKLVYTKNSITSGSLTSLLILKPRQ